MQKVELVKYMTNKNLILTRKKGNKVYVHDGAEVLCIVTVTDISTSQVKLGFEASSNIKIDREEVFNAKINKEEKWK